MYDNSAGPVGFTPFFVRPAGRKGTYLMRKIQ